MRKLNIFAIIFATLVAFVGVNHLNAQGVTTGSMSGVVVDDSGMTLPGATVIVVHEPSGTQYGVATDNNGRFIIPGMRVGSPYRVTVTYVGYEPFEGSNYSVNLGAATVVNITMGVLGVSLDEFVVTALAGSAGRTTGTSTNIGASQIENLPSVSRNLNDFLRLTPQSNRYSGGISFAGINNRFNAIYIDGAVNNDVFGLAGSGTNGGQTGISPFSLDIIDQLQVVLSPYDVTLGGFAGGGINAVTKSGTNQFKGSMYTYFRNEKFVGKTPGVLADRLGLEERTRVPDFKDFTYGFTFGGPIIKDKLFFFANAEFQNDQTPRPFNVSEYTSVAGRVTESQLQQLRDFLINTYGYDPGTFGDMVEELTGRKFFGKIDWNISPEHRLTLRHQYTKGIELAQYAGSRNRINFSNNGRYFPSITNSSAIELNSRLGNKFSNNLIISYVTVTDDRDPIGDPFPYVYIEDVSSGIISFGSEEFSTANRLDQDILSITNNFNIYAGNHKITLGTHNEFYDIYNVFIGQNYGTYRYANLNAFLTGAPAIRYDRSYSLLDNSVGDNTLAAADFKAMQLGIYAQDEWAVNRNFTVTAGMRVDVPIITTHPAEDTYFNQIALPNIIAHYPIAENVKSGRAPSGQIMLSPRFGFSWDIAGDRSSVLRGGAGIFTSRVPFVWPGAMFTNDGQTLGRVNQNNIAGPVLFRPDIANQYVHPNPSLPTGQVDIFTQDFKYPQVFRGNLAYDFKLPGGIEGTLEGLYTKTLNNINYTQVNSSPNVAFNWTGGPDNRPVYVNQSIDTRYSAIYLASNTSEGYTYTISASLAKAFDFGLMATLAYSYNDGWALSEGTSSQNSSQWRGHVNVDGRNNPSYGRADFAFGHRVVSSLSYGHKWNREGNVKTTISLFASGQSGNPFSFVIAGGINAQNVNREVGSVNANRSLVFIPATASDINLVNYTVAGNTVTAAQQWENLNAFIESDPYLSKNRGKYAEKNAAWAPFESIFDVAVRQDLGIKVGGETHRFQLSFDIANFANFLNKNWGTRYSIPGNFNNYFLYQFEGYESNGTTPRFTYRKDKAGLEDYNISGLGSRWSMQFGLRYMFN